MIEKGDKLLCGENCGENCGSCTFFECSYDEETGKYRNDGFCDVYEKSVHPTELNCETFICSKL